MMVAVPVMGSVANESDVARVARAWPAKASAFSIAVLMNDSYGSMLAPARERGKNETHGQEYEEAGDKAVPLHDPEQRA